MKLPAQHNALVTEICKVNPNVVVVLSNGGPIEMPWVDKPKAIFESYLLGEAGGAAIIDLVFGEQSPSGKLSESFPIQLSDVLADKNFPGTRDKVEYREGLDVGYRYFDSAQRAVRFPFGHGLTYTTFSYGELDIELHEDDLKSKLVNVSFDLTNEGKVAAKEVVQCYVHDVSASVYRPFQELRAFDKVLLQPGETKRVSLLLSYEAFSFYDIGVKDWIVEPGSFEIRVGSSSRDIRQKEIIEFKMGESASAAAQASYPPRSYGVVEEVDDEVFSRRFGGTVLEAIDRSIPTNHAVVNRNSLLKEVSSSSTLGKFLRWVVFKGATNDLKPGPSFQRDQKLLEAAVCNLPLRTMVLFGSGMLSFELMDAMISTMNGLYGKAVAEFFVALIPFRKKATNRSIEYSPVPIEP